MIVRIAKEQDMKALLDIYNYEVEHGVATFDLEPKTMEERMEWFYAHNIGNHPLIVAEEDGRVAGYASLSAYRDKEAYAATVELSVYIDPEYRGRGVATMLMKEILEEARRRTDIRTVVSVITSGNDASIRLHEKFDFIYCGSMTQVGEKFGRMLGVDYYQLLV
ncbi:MAG: N-acetyltransferase family protein [Lachnospiraceae bacterium]